MFGRKQKNASLLRFCERAIELPYGPLFSYREFTIAIARVSLFRSLPNPRGPIEPEAYGLLHGSSIFQDGSEEPILPVKITFENRSYAAAHFGSGYVDQHYYGDGKWFYFLNLTVDDPELGCFKVVDESFERAVMSGYRFMHVRCHKNYETKPNTKDTESFSVRYQQQQAFLRSVDTGEAELPNVIFDEFLFHDELRGKAPSWSADWPDFEGGGKGFFSRGTGKHRQQRRRWAD
jgi:hypothetical protein